MHVVHLAAAISLQEAIGQILAEFSLAEPTIQVRAIFGASNELADHLLAGAAGDLYIAAEQSELKRLKAARLLAPRSRRLIATNGLTVVGAEALEAVANAGCSAEERHCPNCARSSRLPTRRLLEAVSGECWDV